MTCASRYTTTTSIVRRQNRILKPATEMITSPMEDPNLGFRTLSGAESAGVLYVPSKYMGGDEILNTPEYEVPMGTTFPF